MPFPVSGWSWALSRGIAACRCARYDGAMALDVLLSLVVRVLVLRPWRVVQPLARVKASKMRRI